MGRFLMYIIGITFLLSTVDGILTVIEVENGWAREANPFMGHFLRMHPAIFMLAKSFIVFAALSFVYKNRNLGLARATACGSLILYSAVIGWHLHGLVNV